MIGRAAWLVVLAAGAMAGCGQDAPSPAGSDGSDRTTARAVVGRYLTAYGAKDGAAVCALLTSPMRAHYGSNPEECASEAGRIARVSPMGPDCDIRRDAADGDARFVVHFMCTMGGGAEVTLVKGGSQWLVDQDLSCVTPDFCKPN